MKLERKRRRERERDGAIHMLITERRGYQLS